MQPLEPNRPADTQLWRVLQHPAMLLLIGGLTCGLAAMLASILGHALRWSGSPGAGLVAAIVVAGVVAGAYIAFVRLLERRAAVELGGAGWAGQLTLGILTGVLLFSAVVAVIALLGGYRVVGTRDAAVLVPMLSIAIVSGVTEEIFFRGLFFRLVERWLGSWIALAASAALFGALHLGNPNATWLAGTAIALEAGIMLAALYMLTRRLWAPIGLHGAWNLAQGGIYGIPVSGFAADGLLVPRIAGPDWMTGGAFGAEASLPAVLICTGFGVTLLAIAWRSDRFVAPGWRRRGAITAG